MYKNSDLHPSAEAPNEGVTRGVVSSTRFRIALKLFAWSMLGKMEVNGLENLETIPKERRLVVATSHITDVDIQIAAIALAKSLDLVITNQLTQYDFSVDPISNIGMRMAGLRNFMPIQYSGKDKKPTFNPADFEAMLPRMTEGRSIIVAAHNPSHSGKLGKGGCAAVFLATLAGAMILPVGIDVESKNGIQLGMAEEPLKTLLGRPRSKVNIGKPFELDSIRNQQFLEAMERKGQTLRQDDITVLKRALRPSSDSLMERISELVPPEKRL